MSDTAHSRTVYTRRDFMEAAIAAAALPVVAHAEEPTDNYEVINANCEEYAGIETYRGELNSKIERLISSSIKSLVPEVCASQFAQRQLDYNPAELSRTMHGLVDVDGFYARKIGDVESKIKAWSTGEEWLARVRADQQRARQYVSDEEANIDRWMEESGYNEYEREEDDLYRRLVVLRDHICSMPCLSLRDCRIKAEFADRWLSDRHISNILEVLKSIAGHAVEVA